MRERESIPALRARVHCLKWLAAALAAVALASALGGCSRADTHAQAQPPPPPLQFAGAWGMKGDAPGELDHPVCIAADGVGNIYIADGGSLFIHKFDPRGTPLLSFQDPILKQPDSIAVDSGGAIYVTDSSRGMASIYLPNGDRLRTLRLRTRPRAEQSLGISVDDSGLIHIFDADGRRIFTYTPRWRLLRAWQPATSVAGAEFHATAMAGSPIGDIYLADQSSNRIVRFNGDGQYLSETDAGGNGVDRRLSSEFAVWNAYIFAMDADGRQLHIFSPDGKPKVDLDLAPELGQGSRLPPPLAVSPRKELLVLDTPETRVLRYRINF